MEFYDFDDIIYLKNYEKIFNKVKEMKTLLLKMDISSDKPSAIEVKNNKISFSLRLTLPFT